MKTSNVVLQPDEFRPTHTGFNQIPPARWAFYPNLHLLLGWGDGLWETLGDRMSGVKLCHVDGFPIGQSRRELENFEDWHDRYHRNAATPASLLIVYGGTRQLDHEGEYRLRDATLDDHPFDFGHLVFLEVRTKELKPEHRCKMEEFGLVYEPGTGRLRLGGGERHVRNDAEQRWAAYVSHLKAVYVEKRVAELLASMLCHRSRQFYAVREKMVRSRTGEIQRGKNNSQGIPHVMYTEEELDRGAAHSLARKEATECMFDFIWKPVCRYSENDGIEILSL